MIRAQVKGIFTFEMDHLEAHVPEDPENFTLLVRVLVGPRNDIGEESFDIRVCTPKWVTDACNNAGFVLGRHLLIVPSFDPKLMRELIVNLVEACNGDTWKDVAEKLSRLGHWEFEDYRDEGQGARSAP